MDRTSTIAGLPSLSIVVPFFNESESLPKLLADIVATSKALPEEQIELLLIDDGSTDDSSEIAIQHLSSVEGISVRLFRLHRNSGQTAALDLGFKSSSGRRVVALDADGQNRPEDIPKLLSVLDDGYDCVSGWRKNRQDSSRIRMKFSKVANSLLQKFSGVVVEDSGCTLKAYKGDTIRSLSLYADMHRFIPHLLALDGGKITNVEVSHRPREQGHSKYTLSRTWSVFADIILIGYRSRFQNSPLRLMSSLGLLLLFIGMLLLFSALLGKFVFALAFVESPLILTGAFSILGGVQLLTSGFIADSSMQRDSDIRGRGAAPKIYEVTHVSSN